MRFEQLLLRETTIVFDRKILRQMYGPLYYNIEKERYKGRHTNELHRIYEKPNGLLYFRSK